MDKKSKVLIIIFIIAVFISIFFTYKRAFIDRNFEIIQEEESNEEELATEEEVVREENIQGEGLEEEVQ